MKGLFIKFINLECTEKEVQEIIEYFKSSNDLADVPTIEAVSKLLDTYPIMEEDDANRIYKNIQVLVKPQENKPAKKKQYIWRYAAAVLVVGLLATTYVFRNNTSNTPVEVAPIIVNTIVPGTDKATLTLADGSVVALEKGTSFQTKNANSNGKKIIYKAKSINKKTEVAYNYLTIPRGGQFHIVLSEGREVWLNAESQLKYPVSCIDGNTRQVELIYGEAYFDVSPSTSHNGSKFKVFNQSQEVEVLGTEFNIKAYKDETNIYTTLVEGKVTIGNGDIIQNLIPDHQTILDIETNEIKITAVDVNSETSWRKGVFSFKGKPLKDIMKVISRWYDVDVVFVNKDLESVKFKGNLNKNQSIERILSIMLSNKLNQYEIKNKTIILK